MWELDYLCQRTSNSPCRVDDAERRTRRSRSSLLPLLPSIDCDCGQPRTCRCCWRRANSAASYVHRQRSPSSWLATKADDCSQAPWDSGICRTPQPQPPTPTNQATWAATTDGLVVVVVDVVALTTDRTRDPEIEWAW